MAQRLYSYLFRSEFFLAKYQGNFGSAFIRPFELGFETTTTQVYFNIQSRDTITQRLSQKQCLFRRCLAHRDKIRIKACRTRVAPAGFVKLDQTLQPNGPTYRRRSAPAQMLNQTIVATS